MKLKENVFERCTICQRGRFRFGDGKYSDWKVMDGIKSSQCDAAICERCQQPWTNSQVDLSLAELNRLGRIVPRFKW